MDPDEAVYDVVRRIPPGRVATYGQVAALVAEYSLTARQVGGLMRFAPEGVPWHRVVGAGGTLPIGKRSAAMRALQRRLLEAERVTFGSAGRICMDEFQWRPDFAPKGAS
ncbi:MAG: MGMT family protein [Chthonomonadales bacterium]